VFRAAGTSLFPERRADLSTSCSCPDWGNPCKHVAATHYVLGEALDRDPFLLFELRGRSKAQVLDSLRRARTGAEADLAAPSERSAVPATRFDPADYDRAPASLPALEFSFDAPSTHGAILRQLGMPATWKEAVSPAEALTPLVQQAADAARRLALADPANGASAEDPSAEPSQSVAPPPRARARRTAAARAGADTPSRPDTPPKRAAPKAAAPKTAARGSRSTKPVKRRSRRG
ncbi:MAG TPA: SWIM zinc finger family protein, partial [Polyangiaceae bacterium]|nr:SWIM zinc finger family protein [Polyangiaceae bacterium]